MALKFSTVIFILVVGFLLMQSSVTRFFHLPSFLAKGVFPSFTRSLPSMADATDAVPVGVFSAAFVTVPNSEVAEKIAGGLVTNKLAACVNIIPGVTSVYEWEGKIEKDSELLLMIKTRTDRMEEVSAWVKDNHPYDVCEVISTKIDKGNPPYLKWLGDIVSPKL